MNPQQIQQVRLLATEQIQPFQKQLLNRIEEIEKKIQNGNDSENLKQIIKNQEIETNQLRNIIQKRDEENKELKEAINNQKEDLKGIIESITTNLNNQVNNHFNKYTEDLNKNINNQISPILNKFTNLENGNLLEVIYNKKISITQDKILQLKRQLDEKNTKKEIYNSRRKVIEEIEECMDEPMPNIAKIELLKKKNNLISEIENIKIEDIEINIKEIEENLRKQEEEKCKLKSFIQYT